MKPVGDIDVIKAILSKAHENLKTSQIDFDNERYNDSVSRAYYAVFHAISAVLLSKGLHFSSYAQTIGAFNREFVNTKQFPAFYAKTIRKLFKERQEEYLAKIYNVSKEYWKD